jgi:hypothetical protein
MISSRSTLAAHLDNGSAALLAHRRQDCAHQRGWHEQVQVYGLAQVGVGNLFCRSDDAAARVVDQNVDRAESAGSAGDEPGECCHDRDARASSAL